MGMFIASFQFEALPSKEQIINRLKERTGLDIVVTPMGDDNTFDIGCPSFTTVTVEIEHKENRIDIFSDIQFSVLPKEAPVCYLHAMLVVVFMDLGCRTNDNSRSEWINEEWLKVKWNEIGWLKRTFNINK